MGADEGSVSLCLRAFCLPYKSKSTKMVMVMTTWFISSLRYQMPTGHTRRNQMKKNPGVGAMAH